ncbi:carotenoid ester lipase [Ganoderma leucocontextum]|nr:carotenoid ester lipase [Ganoderma leucocontextum]
MVQGHSREPITGSMAFIRTSSLLMRLLAAGMAVGSPVLSGRAEPTVVLDNATVIGQPNGTTIKYLGLPFAQPPVGDLRLRLPQPVLPYNGTINATAFGNQCIQQTFPSVTLPSDVPAAAGEYLANFFANPDVPTSEDCLNLNVIVPANATAESELPVALWIYGGGFQVGSNVVNPGENIVARSIELDYPIIYVAVNYRLSAFGFLGGKEVKEAAVANLGLHDQREAMRWVHKYIAAFGGDPSKVMIWGESAGSISVALHMLYNGGNADGLFRAGFMESGNAFPTGYVDNDYLQSTYDGIVDHTGCSNSSDTLQCLREVPASVLKAAMDKTPSPGSYQQVNSPWLPRADGVFVLEPPEQWLLSSPIADIPFVTGNDLDEGTVVSFGTLNVTTDEEFLDYLESYYYLNTPADEVAKILELYPSDPAAGSPYNTGDNDAYSPQYKRMSSWQGDFIAAPRRLFTQYLADKQPVYVYLSNFHQVDGIGAAHGTELFDIYGGGPLQDYLIRFAATLDPNGQDAATWPRYTNDSPQLLTFNDVEPTLNITLDTFRAEQMEYLTKLSLVDPV